jgi:hypothetical protein
VNNLPAKATRRSLFAVLSTALAHSFAKGVRHLPPVDESWKDKSFRSFRRALLLTLKERNVNQLLRAVASDILGGFGGDGGRDEFRTMWHLEKPETSRIWETLAGTIGLGSVRNQNGPPGFTAPYVYALFPENLDAFTHYVVVQAAAKLYEHANTTSAVVETLHWDIVEDVEGDLRLVDWRQVRAASGRIGFVREENVRSPIGYRATFEKRNGQWFLTAFVEGD